MTNNDIFKKLRVALMLRDDQIVEILELRSPATTASSSRRSRCGRLEG